MTQTNTFYKTQLVGQFLLDKPLQAAHADYLVAFGKTRHMRWKMDQIVDMPDPIREKAGLPLGEHGEYFVASLDDPQWDSLAENICVQTTGQPNLYCDWRPTGDRQGIEWNQKTDTYFYADWLAYVVEHFIRRWGYVLNGDVCWQGDDPTDSGVIQVRENTVRVIPNNPPNIHSYFG